MPANKIEREIRDALLATGHPFEIKPPNGTMHRQVYLAGKKIGVICICDKKRHDAKQILSKIRQRMKELNHAVAT